MSEDPNIDPQTTPNPSPAGGTPEGTQEPPEGKPNQEAAKYRRRLRETEAERDALRTRLDEHDREEVERWVGEVLADPEDFWAVASLDDLRADDGSLDTRKVATRLRDVAKEKPRWVKPRLDLHQGPRGTTRRNRRRSVRR